MFSIGRVIRIRARCLSFAEGMRYPMFECYVQKQAYGTGHDWLSKSLQPWKVSLTHAVFSVEGYSRRKTLVR